MFLFAQVGFILLRFLLLLNVTNFYLFEFVLFLWPRVLENSQAAMTVGSNVGVGLLVRRTQR